MSEYSEEDFSRAYDVGVEVERAFRAKIEENNIFAAPLTVKTRVKSKQNIESKVNRRRKNNPDFNLSDITDIVGARIVTLYGYENANVAKEIFRFFDKNDDFHLPGAQLKKFKHYRALGQLGPDSVTGTATDPILPFLKDLEKKYQEWYPDNTVKLSVKDEALYSSTHIVFSYPIGNKPDHPASAMEVQIRSVFEDAYAEIDHKIFFEYDRNDGFSNDQRRRTITELHLLRSMLDNSAKLAEVIRARQIELTATDTDIKKNLDDAAWVKAKAEAAEMNGYSDIFQGFVQILEEKAKVDNNSSADSIAYGMLARKFDVQVAKFNERLERDPPKDDQISMLRPIAYHVYQEGALCRLLSGDRAQVHNAAAIYKDLATNTAYGPAEFDFTLFPTAWFRLAQANAWQMEICTSHSQRADLAEAAFDNYQQAQTNLADIRANTIDSDISTGQIKYLNANIIRLQSFVLWRLSDFRRRPVLHEVPLQPELADLELVSRAWETIKDLFESIVNDLTVEDFVKKENEHAINILNTGLYYIFDGCYLASSLNMGVGAFPDHEKFQCLVERFADCMEAMANRAPAKNDAPVPPDHFRHTLMRCLLVLGMESEAKAQAGIIVDNEHTLPPPKMLSLYRQWNLKRIWREAYLIDKGIYEGKL